MTNETNYLPIIKPKLTQKKSHNGSVFAFISIHSISVFIAFLLPSSLIIFSYLFWNKPEVDKNTCTCSCFDNVLKGPYEAGISGYKHVYFNATKTTLILWGMTVGLVISTYECTKRFLKLAFAGQLRTLMCLLFLGSIHSHIYGWWAHFNYLNDEFFRLWNSQLLFTSTEILALLIVLSYMDKSITMGLYPLLTLLTISLFHLYANFFNQILANFFFGGQADKSSKFQFFVGSRDVVLFLYDQFAFLVTLYCIRNQFTRSSIITWENREDLWIKVRKPLMFVTLLFLMMNTTLSYLSV